MTGGSNVIIGLITRFLAMGGTILLFQRRVAAYNHFRVLPTGESHAIKGWHQSRNIPCASAVLFIYRIGAPANVNFFVIIDVYGILFMV